MGAMTPTRTTLVAVFSEGHGHVRGKPLRGDRDASGKLIIDARRRVAG